MKILSSVSIRKSLLIAFITLAILPVIFVNSVLSWKNISFQQGQAVRNQQEIAKRVSIIIRSTIGNIKYKLFSVSSQNNLLNIPQEELKTLLSKTMHIGDDIHKDAINSIALVSESGMEVLKVSRTEIYTSSNSRNLSTSDEYRMPYTTGLEFVSNVYIDKETGEPLVILALPVKEPASGLIIGVLVAEIRIAFMWDIITSIQIGKAGAAYILDSKGRVLAYRDPSLILKKTILKMPPKTGLGKGLLGENSVTASEQLRISNQIYYVVVELPASETFEHLSLDIMSIVSFLMLSLTGSISLWLIVSKRIIKPIEALSHTAGMIESGDFSLKSHIFRKDEIGRLAVTFNKMTDRLTTTINSQKVHIENYEKANKNLEEKSRQLEELNRHFHIEMNVRKKAEYQSAQINHLAALGLMTTAIVRRTESHSEAIVETVKTLSKQIDPDSAAAISVASLLRTSENTLNTLQVIMALGNSDNGVRQPAAISEIISECVHICETFMGNDIHIYLTIPNNLPDIMLQPQLVRLVILNLLCNADKFLDESPGNANFDRTINIQASEIQQEGKLLLKLVFIYSDLTPRSQITEDILFPFSGNTAKNIFDDIWLNIIKSIMSDLGGTLNIEKSKTGSSIINMELPAFKHLNTR
ncbi:MAG: HAMP domain-containing protein [Nitrospira sp.]|nr:HAMP domain-containing protein [bacterium]MBL7048203.1 HAMP domain-containing protein [Nitrospira sp.]